MSAQSTNGVAFHPPAPMLFIGADENQNAELKSQCLILFQNFYLLAIVNLQHYQETNLNTTFIFT